MTGPIEQDVKPSLEVYRAKTRTHTPIGGKEKWTLETFQDENIKQI